ncbi:uncharacterized protein [Antedon mediterranea]|uniref:uncharacterized protein isoform X2 n=1 Tax=Antedon mediterranea TaxID=105859 RepID=UPI003AF77DCE
MAIMLSDLKDGLSRHYDGEKYLWIKCCLFDHLDLSDITQPDQTAIDLFNALEAKGIITPTNVKLLHDIAELSQLKEAVDLVSQYIKDNKQSIEDYQQLSPYRRTLFKALKQVDPDALKKVISYYKLKNFKFQNIWDVVLKLEIDGQFANTPDKIRTFACRLGQRAKNILLHRGTKIPVTVNTKSNLSVLHDCVDSIEQENKLSQSIPASFKCVGLGINDPKASLFFRLFTSERKALKELMDMHAEDELINGLADILKPQNRKKFVEDWKTCIDFEEYKAALKDLKDKGVPLIVTLVKNQSSSSANDSERPQALELLFKQKEWSKTTVDVVHGTITNLVSYFEEKHLQFEKVETGSIVLHLVSHDTEALDELWSMYCANKLQLQTDLKHILVKDHKDKQQLNITINETNYKNALKKLKEFEEFDKKAEELLINMKEEPTSPKSQTDSDDLSGTSTEESGEMLFSIKKEPTSLTSQTIENYHQLLNQMFDKLKELAVLKKEYQQKETIETKLEKKPLANKDEVVTSKPFKRSLSPDPDQPGPSKQFRSSSYLKEEFDKESKELSINIKEEPKSPKLEEGYLDDLSGTLIEMLPISFKEEHGSLGLVKPKTDKVGTSKQKRSLIPDPDEGRPSKDCRRSDHLTDVTKYYEKQLLEEKKPSVKEECKDIPKAMKHDIDVSEHLKMFQEMLDQLRQIAVLETQEKEMEHEKVSVEGIRHLNFTYIKEEFSRWYDKRESLSSLKTLYKDLLLPHMLDKASSTIDLLEFLIESNHLTSKDFTLFFDTINATGEFELVRKIKEEVITFPNVEEISVSKFSRHRRMLVEFGNKLTTKNVESISDLVNEAPKSYKDKWDLINDLENRQIISEGKMQLFIEKLGILKLGEPEEVLTKYPVKPKKPRKSRKNESEDQVEAKKPRKSKKKTTLRDYVREMFVEKKCSVKTDSEKSPKEMDLIKGIDDSEPSTSHQQLLSQDTMTDEDAIDEICNSMGSEAKKKKLSWLDAPDDVFFHANETTKHLRQQVSNATQKRAARRPYKLMKIAAKHTPPKIVAATGMPSLASQGKLHSQTGGKPLVPSAPMKLLPPASNPLSAIASKPTITGMAKMPMTGVAKLPPSAPGPDEIQDDMFAYVKEEFCQWYDKRDSLNLLKALYKDLLLPHILYKASSTIDLLEFLIEFNHLTSQDFTLFYDTINATGEFELVRKIQEEVVTFPNVEEISVSKFSRHRCMLVEFGNKLTTKNVECISDLVNEAPTSYEDKWDLINDLENRQIISEGKMQLFINRLSILKLGEPEEVLTKYASEDSVKTKKPRKSRKNESEDQVKAKKPRKSKKSIDDSEPSTSHQQLPSKDTMTDEHAVDEICNSVRRFCTYMRRGKSLKTDQGIIKMMNNLEIQKWKNRNRWKWIRKESSEDIGRMLAHVLIAVKDERFVLSRISQLYIDDVVKGLSIECSKYTFKYNIEVYASYADFSTSFLIHLLINAPRLKMLQLSNFFPGVTMNYTVGALSKKGLVLELENLDIHSNYLNDITGSILGTLLAISPKLKTLNMSDCSLSGVTIDAMLRECVNRNLVFELDNLDIHDNDLSYITGSVLGTLLATTPKLKTLDISYCSLSGVIIDAMVRECANRNLVLELDNLDIQENTLSDITGSSLGTLLAISPKLKTLNMYSCRLSSVIIDAMVRECVNRNLVLELDSLNIGGNALSDITGSSFGTLLAISPKLKTLNIRYCRLSGVVINAIVRECVNRNLVLELDNLDIHGNTLSDITGSSFGTLLAISPKLKILNIGWCSLSGVIIDAMVRECVNRNLVLELENLNVIVNILSDITGSSLGTLLAISPKLKTLNMYHCRLSGVIIDAMVRECVNRNLVLELDKLVISENTLSDITGSSLTTLLAISPKLKKLHMRGCQLPNDIVQNMRQHFQSINGKFYY